MTTFDRRPADWLQPGVALRRIVDAAKRRESVAAAAAHELGQNGEIEGVLAMATDLPHASWI